MSFIRNHKLMSAAGGLIAIVLLVMLGTGIYVASVAGDLPWQEDPTRVADSITPFAGLDVFIPPTVAPTTAATATPQ